jgi:hypothetical protein
MTKMSPERFQDRFEFYKNEPQQVSAVWMLYQALEKSAPELLDDQAAWVRKFSEKPAPPVQPDSVANFNPAGSEEQGMFGPKKHPTMRANDTYLLVNDRDEDMEAFDYQKKLLWRVPCLARGQGGEREWKTTNTDTPPGLYKLGQLYDDISRVGNNPSYDRTLLAYGWQSYDMEDLEGNEDNYGRAGIMIHGGGSACGWPGAWARKQPLYPTYGCIRVHNSVLTDLIHPRYKKGTVYVGVYQEV